jgi:hypothetical protein
MNLSDKEIIQKLAEAVADHIWKDAITDSSIYCVYCKNTINENHKPGCPVLLAREVLRDCQKCINVGSDKECNCANGDKYEVRENDKLMNRLKVIQIEDETIIFNNGVILYSDHDSDCCEHHWLATKDLTLSDFEGLEFDLTNDNFFKRIEGYGIELIPIEGHSIKIPGYGENNGYYSDNLSLIISENNKIVKEYDITECQDVKM